MERYRNPDTPPAPRLIALLILFVALVPRVVGLDDFVTYDEAYHWIGRTERFAAALQTHQWGDTWQVSHPGVSLLWLGSAGMLLEHTATVLGWGTSASPLAHLAWLRLPSAIVQGMLIAGSYLLLRRLVSPYTALLAALLWAASPFLVAHARLLHLDALLTGWVTLSLLCVLVACQHTPPDRRWLTAAGVCTGLALLTKSPSLILLPAVGGGLFWHGVWRMPTALGGMVPRLRGIILAYLLWLIVAAGVVVLLWPALWVAPLDVLHGYVQKISGEGENPFVNAQFFFGQTVSDPGPLFYPVIVLFRTAPPVLFGVLLVLFAAWRGWLPQRERTMLLVLGAWGLFWVLVMTSGAKKFDRYILPMWPVLLVLAASGWSVVLHRLHMWAGQHPRGVLLHRASVLLLVAAVAQPTLTYHPYYLSYYSPLMGGGAVAQRVLLIGWGEGMDRVGAYLRGRPDIGYGPVLSSDMRLLQPFVPVPVKHIAELNDGTQNYAVLSLPAVQRSLNPDVTAAIQQMVPIHRETIHGIDYAVVYQLPRPFEQPIGAQFGGWLWLHGVTVTHEPGRLVVVPSWGVRAPATADYWVVVRLLDQHGHTVAQVDVPPGGADIPPTSAWDVGQQVAVPLPLPLPDPLPAGPVRLTLAVYNPATGERLPLVGGNPADPTTAGAHALLLDTRTLR